MATSNLSRIPKNPTGYYQWLQAFVRIWDSLFEGQGDRSIVMLGQLRGQTQLVGVVDGVNTTYTVPYNVLRDSSTGNPLALLFTKNLGYQIYGTNWTMIEKPQRIVLTVAPLAGDELYLGSLICLSK